MNLDLIRYALNVAAIDAARTAADTRFAKSTRNDALTLAARLRAEHQSLA